MIFSLDVRRARKGDCLLVHYGTKQDPGLMLIDGGPAHVYKPQLKPRLTTIKKKEGLAANEPLPIRLMMISHIDDDHINGILELTKDLVTARDAGDPLPWKISSVWHNTFDDIIGNPPAQLLAAMTAKFGAAALGGSPATDAFDPQTAMVVASVGQGFSLRDDAKKLKLRINPEFKGKLIMATATGKRANLGHGLKLTVAGPMKAELVALQKDHDKFLKAKTAKKAQASLAAFADTSVANLSSIVVLAEMKKKTILLTGDARGDKILKGLELVKKMKKGGKLHVDILKIPHHGSDRNIAPSFFKRITADHYVFSGNGEHGNPERETLQMLLDARGNESYTVHLTYPVKDIDVERKLDWQEQLKKERARKKKKPTTKVRANWSAKKHSLKSFLAAHKTFAKKISIVEDKKPHVIDLLDAVGY